VKKNGVLTGTMLKDGRVAKANLDQFAKEFPKGVVMDAAGVAKLQEKELLWALTIMMKSERRDEFVARERKAGTDRTAASSAAWESFKAAEQEIHKQFGEAKAKVKQALNGSKDAAEKAYSASVAEAFFNALDD